MAPPSTLYVQQISSLKNGLALWDPHPGFVPTKFDGKLTEPIPHVRPGDVGYVANDGTFTRLFNIHLPRHHRNQGKGPFPEHFEPVDLDPSRVHWRPEAPIVYRSYKRLNIFGAVKTVALPVPINGSTSFAFKRNAGAFLSFFDTGSREDSQMDQIYQKQIRENGSTWLLAAQVARSGCRPEDLILVTGCTRVRSWIIGVTETESTEGHLTLSVGFTPDDSVGSSLSTSVRYENSRGSSIRCGPSERLKDHPEPANLHRSGPKSWLRAITRSGSSAQSLANANAIKNRSDQCIFIRGFRMKLRIRGGMVPKNLKAAAEPRDPSKDREPGEDGEDVIETWDHMHAALDYILENSDVDIALVHEDNLLAYVRAIEGTPDDGHGYITVGQVLKRFRPEITVQEYDGMKAGVFAETTEKRQSVLKGVNTSVTVPLISNKVPCY